MGSFLAPPARLELTTLRLGGARSIPVSYGGILKYYSGRMRLCQGAVWYEKSAKSPFTEQEFSDIIR